MGEREGERAPSDAGGQGSPRCGAPRWCTRHLKQATRPSSPSPLSRAPLVRAAARLTTLRCATLVHTAASMMARSCGSEPLPSVRLEKSTVLTATSRLRHRPAGASTPRRAHTNTAHAHSPPRHGRTVAPQARRAQDRHATVPHGALAARSCSPSALHHAASPPRKPPHVNSEPQPRSPLYTVPQVPRPSTPSSVNCTHTQRTHALPSPTHRLALAKTPRGPPRRPSTATSFRGAHAAPCLAGAPPSWAKVTRKGPVR